MTRARAFCGFVLGVFGGGALVAPWLWWLGRWARTRWPWAELDWLVDHPFPRYVHRCLLVLALAGLWPLSRAVGCRTWEAVGWGGRPGCWRRMAIGFMAGMFGFSVLLGAEMWMGARVWKEGMDGSLLVAGILRAMLAGVVVAVVEETLFAEFSSKDCVRRSGCRAPCWSAPRYFRSRISSLNRRRRTR